MKKGASGIRRIIWFSAILYMVIFLVSCQTSENNNEDNVANGTDNETINNDSNDNNDNNNNNDDGNEEEDEDPYPYSLDPYEIEVEPEGDLFAEYIGDKESSDDDSYDAAEEEALDALVDEVEAMDPDEYDEPEKIAGIIINKLRTHHAPGLDDIRDFEVEIDDIELPDGRPLSDVKEEDLEEDPPETNVAVILDASGSMKADVQGGEKMELARKSVKTFTDNLADYVNVALYVFGHEGSGDEADKELSCTTIDDIYELGEYDSEAFDEALNSFDAKGWTPIANSLSLVRDDLVDVSDEETKNIIYLISDGIETCDGNPVETVEEIKDDIDNVTINIIGFDVDDAADQLLKDIADAGDGKYNAAQNEAQLGEAIEDQWHQKISDTELAVWGAHEIVDIQSQGNALYSDFDDNYRRPVDQALSREERRLNSAAISLNDEDLLGSDQFSDIVDILEERSTSIKEHSKNISSDKRDKIKEQSDEMKDLLEKIEEEFSES